MNGKIIFGTFGEKKLNKTMFYNLDTKALFLALGVRFNNKVVHHLDYIQNNVLDIQINNIFDILQMMNFVIQTYVECQKNGLLDQLE